MKQQFKEQDVQVKAVKSVVDYFIGQLLKTNRFTLERSNERIRKTSLAATDAAVLDLEVEEEIGCRNRASVNEFFNTICNSVTD